MGRRQLVGWDDDRAQGRRSYALLRFDDGQTWRESADKDWSLCSLKCVRQFAQLAEWVGDSLSAGMTTVPKADARMLYCVLTMGKPGAKAPIKIGVFVRSSALGSLPSLLNGSET